MFKIQKKQKEKMPEVTKKHNMTKRLVLLRKKKYNRLVKHSLCTTIIEIRKREHNSIIVEEKLIFIYNSGFAVGKRRWAPWVVANGPF